MRNSSNCLGGEENPMTDKAQGCGCVAAIRSDPPKFQHEYLIVRSFDCDYPRVVRELEEAVGLLRELVAMNEEHNRAIERIIGRPPMWNDSYLDKAREFIDRKARA
jgi:hypothetical protein